jgi:hypothetical protein
MVAADRKESARGRQETILNNWGEKMSAHHYTIIATAATADMSGML